MAHPVTTTDARQGLTNTVKRFRQQGATAEPLIFGSHRKPEAVMLPYEAYEALVALAEEVGVAATIRERDAGDTGRRYSLREVAEEFGVDLTTL